MTSMIYTTQPIPPVDTLNSHAGFAIICVIVVGILVAILLFREKGERILGSFISLCLVVIVSGIVSLNTGSITTYENRPVVGTLVGFQAEGFNEARRVGKQTRRVDVHYTYAVYNIEGVGDVLFPARPGMVYPERAQLYANRALEQ